MDSIHVNFALNLISFHLFVRVQASLPNPIISYCTSETNTGSLSTQCNFTQISNSTFEFGKINKNVIQLNSQLDPKLVFLKCEAPYPIRWLAHKPLGSVYYVSNDETNQMDQNPASKAVANYTQAVFMFLRETFSRKFRCESYSVSTNTAEVFINVKIWGISSDNVWNYDTGFSSFFVVNSKSATSDNAFIIPAVASEFQGKYAIPVTKSHINSPMLRVVGDGCAECICKASSGCENFPCESESVCGEIPSSYYDASQSQGFNDCKRVAVCAQGLIKNYWAKYLWVGTTYDCTKDGVLTCEDFFWNHFTNINGQCGTLNLNFSETANVTTFAQCLVEKQLSFTFLRYEPNDYDPRIGLKLRQSPDFNYSKYELTIPWETGYDGTYTMQPFNSDKRLDAKLYYNNQLDVIRCEITTPGWYKQPFMTAGKCDSFSECVLKFEPLPPNLFTPLSSMSKELMNQYEQSTMIEDVPYQSLATTYSQGYLECSAIFGPVFLSKIDYFFTGLDNTIYLLSEGFPLESIIKMPSKHEQPLKAGLTYSFDCTISTFVLLPTIKFVLGFVNGDQQLVTKERKDASVHTGTRITKSATLTWELRVTMKSGISKIICFAPRINSSEWAQTEINVKVVVLGEQPQHSQPELYFKIGGVIGAILFIALAVIIVFLWRRTVIVVRKLSPEEVEEFLSGNRNLNDNQNEGFDAESIAFHHKFQISYRDLITENKVLGSGQYGIVHEGKYCNLEVAIKSCKPSADVEYFKAFLMEIKVMAYIGEHENIVRFIGAVIDDIGKGKCLAVSELSPLGNLNNYLRKYTAQSSDDPGNVYLTLRDGMELQDSLQLPVLVHFSKQIASGMEYLAQRNVIHGDLATRNVLVFDKYVVKITDFGLSRKLYACSNYKKKSQVPLPWPWMALESLRFTEFSTQTDVWSFGVTMWEIFSMGQVPYSGITWTHDFADQIEAGLRLTKPTHATDDVYDDQCILE